MTTGCAIAGCPLPRAGGAPIELCTEHLLAAHDWVAGRVGITDVLPSPCLACGSRLGVRYPSGWLCAHCEWRVGAMPAPEMPPPRVDVVYYLRFRGRIKIGTSANPDGGSRRCPTTRWSGSSAAGASWSTAVTSSSPRRGCRVPSGSAPPTSSRRTSP